MERYLFTTILILSVIGCSSARNCYVCTDCKSLGQDTNTTHCDGPCYTKTSGDDIDRACSSATELVLFPNIPCFFAMEKAEEFTMCYCNDDLCNAGVKITPVGVMATLMCLLIWKTVTSWFLPL